MAKTLSAFRTSNTEIKRFIKLWTATTLRSVDLSMEVIQSSKVVKAGGKHAWV